MKKVTYFFLTAFLAIIMAFPSITNADGKSGKVDLEKLKKDLPHLFTNNNVGTDFWFTVPPCLWDESGGFNNYIRLFVTSPVATNCVFEIADGSTYKAQMTVPNDVIMFVLDPSIASVYMKTGTAANVPEKIYPGKGIHVYADDPIIVYAAVRYEATSDTWLCIPTAALGKEYIVASYADMSDMYPGMYIPSLSGVTAAFDQTTVTFKLGGNGNTVTAGGIKVGGSATYLLNQGDVVMMSSGGAEMDLTGSEWSADKPFSVVSGNQCANIPTFNRWCDYTAEMDIPTYQWGTDYFVPRLQPRVYAPIVRIFAKTPQTRIFNEGSPVGTFSNIPGVQNKGWYEYRTCPPGVTPHGVSITGSAPIFVEEYNPGAEEDSYDNMNSDPFQMAIEPVQQFQKEVTFCTPGINGLYGFTTNYCNIVYAVDSTGGMPNDMMWCQVQSGMVNWQQLNMLFTTTDYHFSDKIGGTQTYAYKQIKIVDAVYKVKCSKPFACYSFGFDWCDSYGHPTSFATIDLEHPDTNAPVPVYKVNCDGNVGPLEPGGTGLVTDMPNDPNIRSNLAIIQMIQDSSFNYYFTFGALIPGTTIKDTWTLTVEDPTQPARAMIRFADRVGNDTTIVIEYNPAQLEIIPNFYDFGHLKLGQTDTMSFIVKNDDQNNSLKVKRIIMDLGNQHFSILDINPPLPTILPPGGQVAFKVTFKAVEDGEFKDSIGVTDDSCYFRWESQVVATVGEPIIVVGNQANLQYDADFGYVPLNNPTDIQVRVQNIGNAPLVVNGFTPPFNSVFVIKWGADGTPSPGSPWTILPNTFKTFTVEFTPTAAQPYTDSIVFTSDATSIDSIAPLRGFGTKAALFANSYDWQQKRIDRPNFPIPAYATIPDSSAIILKNEGNSQLTVTGLTQINDVDRKSVV